MSIVVLGAVFVDIKGYPISSYIPGGRNAGRVVQVHGGVSRNIVEDIANVELRPTFVSLVDESSAGADVVKKLQSHKVDTRYMRTTPDGMGTWLAIFDNTGDVTASISKRPDLHPIADILDEQGDEIFSQADSILLEIDMEKDIVKRTFALAEKYHKPVYAVVSNMSIAIERRDFCARYIASSATSRRRASCSLKTTTISPPTRCCPSCATRFAARRSAAWSSRWALRVRSLQRSTARKAIAPRKRSTSRIRPALATHSLPEPSSARPMARP